MFVRAWVGARLKTNMAAKEEEIVFKLRNEVEKLRKTDAELKVHEVSCQKAKEWFLNRNSKSVSPPVDEPCLHLPEECQSNIQFSEMLSLLSEIKKAQKRLVMLKYQLHTAQMQQEVALFNNILLNQSLLLQKTQHLPECSRESQEDHQTPLAAWFAEITQSLKASHSEEKIQGKLSDLSRLFYNVCYSDGTRQPLDLLAETISKKKSKRSQRKKDLLQEELQFSTCHKGHCVQISISRSLDNNTSNTLDPSAYHVYLDIQLDKATQRLLEELTSRKSLEDFVKQFVWKEIENLAS